MAAIVVAFVLYPVFARQSESLAVPSHRARELRELRAKKERLYEAIKDLDFERAAGKLSEADHQNIRTDYLGQAAEVVSLIEDIESEMGKAASPPPSKPPAKTKEGREPRRAAEASTPAGEDGSKQEAELTCTKCAQVNPPNARFCFHCGTELRVPSRCPQCGESLPEEARFCTACGVGIPA